MTTTTVDPALAAARPPALALWEKHSEAITTVLCAVFVGGGWVANRTGLGATGTALIFLVGYVLGGYRQAIEGTTTLFKDRELDVDLLMVVAAIGAGESEDEILAFAAAIESLSEHPLARAIVAEAARRNLKSDAATNLQSVPGTGAHAIVGGQTWSIVRRRSSPKSPTSRPVATKR